MKRAFLDQGGGKIMQLTIGHRQYHTTRGSDIHRDGMFLEVTDETVEPACILEVFYSDVSREMTVTLFKPDVPLEVVEWAASEARKWLPPKAE